MGRASYQRRLERLVARREQADEQIRHWTRAWVSRVARLQWFALRLQHCVVVTDDRLLLVPVRYWTRRPAKRFGSLDLAHVIVTDVSAPKMRKLRVEVHGREPLLLQFGGRRRDQAVARWLLEGPPAERDHTEATDAFPSPGPVSLADAASSRTPSAELDTTAAEPAGTAPDGSGSSPTEAAQ